VCMCMCVCASLCVRSPPAVSQSSGYCVTEISKQKRIHKRTPIETSSNGSEHHIGGDDHDSQLGRDHELALSQVCESACVCVCVWVGGWVCVCVCVCVSMHSRSLSPSLSLSP
jgi:hypothetical protein